MRSVKRAGIGFFGCLIFNILLNLEGSIPAWILLACHYLFGISIWWFWGALALWILSLIAWMSFMGWAARCSNEASKPTVNKNPYSVGAKRDSIDK